MAYCACATDGAVEKRPQRGPGLKTPARARAPTGLLPSYLSHNESSDGAAAVGFFLTLAPLSASAAVGRGASGEKDMSLVRSTDKLYSRLQYIKTMLTAFCPSKHHADSHKMDLLRTAPSPLTLPPKSSNVNPRLEVSFGSQFGATFS